MTKTARNAPCATYDREEEPNPVGCTWFNNPPMPSGRQNAPREVTPVPAGYAQPQAVPEKSTPTRPTAAGRGLAATGSSLLPAATGLALAGLALAVHRRRRSA